jgi:phage-related protein
MAYSSAMAWTVNILNDTFESELEALPADMRASFVRIASLIEEFGLQQVGMPHVRHLQDKLWEMRLKGRDGISRALYVTTTGEQVVVVRAFVKKTQKTPAKEIRIALDRANDLKNKKA